MSTNTRIRTNRARTADSFAAEMIGQIELGAWATEVRAGMIGEIGCQAPWTAIESASWRRR